MKPIVSLIAGVTLMCLLRGAELAQSVATVAGIVLENSTEQPLAGVQVALVPTDQLLGPGNPRPTTTTDAEGRFSIETSLKGAFQLVPTKNGFIFYPESYRGRLARAAGSSGVSVRLTETTQIKDLQLRMGRPAVITGRVVDGEGHPVTKGVVADLLRFTYDRDGNHVLRPGGGIGSHDSLNDLGQFRQYGLPPGVYYVGIAAFRSPDVLGLNDYLYYPSLTAEEAMAAPIQVREGEEVDIGTLRLPMPPKSVEFRVGVTVPKLIANVAIEIGGNVFSIFLQSTKAEKLLRILPGHYNLIAKDNSSNIPAYYASTAFDVSGADIELDLKMMPTFRVTGKVVLENASEGGSPLPRAMRCTLDGFSYLDCTNSKVLPGPHRLDFRDLPLDMYVLSAAAGGNDILTNGLNISGDTELEVILGQSEAIISGTARAPSGETLINGSVVLVPAPPYRLTELRYYRVNTDPNGHYEIHGIAPGSYQLFAWTELEGAAYRNAEFMKEFEDRGEPVKIELAKHQTVDLTAF